MDAYDPKAVCPKCNHEEVYTRYSNPAGEHNTKCYERKEHLDRKCIRCGYEWEQACAN